MDIRYKHGVEPSNHNGRHVKREEIVEESQVENDDGPWTDAEQASNSMTSSVLKSRTKVTGSPRLRRLGPRQRKSTVARIPGSPRRLPPSLSPATTTPNEVLTSQPSPTPISHLFPYLKDALLFAGKYMLDIFSTAIRYLRLPLAFLLLMCLLSFVISMSVNVMRNTFAPLCVLPGISSMALCLPPVIHKDKGSPPRWADYPKLIDLQGRTFGQLLESSNGGSSLSLEIKKAEMATSDLTTLVRVSDLKSKGLLADSLKDFIQDAKKAGKGLQKLTSKIGGSVDNIMAINDYALNAIAQAQTATTSRSFVQSLNPWAIAPDVNKVITESFTSAMDVVSNDMRRLIVEAEVNLANLNELEERMATVHEIIAREDASLASAKSELLAELWTKLGGNKKTLHSFESNLHLLKDLGDYRKRALVHVVAALQTLNSMSEDMEDLRERVAAPELMGTNSIPVEVHLKSIHHGLQRLKEGRIRAKSIEDAQIRRVLGTGAGDS